MATPFIIQRIKSERKKDKATVEGFIYTLSRMSIDVEYWVCEKRGVCNSRIHTRSNNIIKRTTSSELFSGHSHGPDPAKLEMLKAYTILKANASNSEMSTISHRYTLSSKGESFLLFDSGIGDANSMHLFGTPKCLTLLKESDSWYCDGTFKVAPEHFFQLYTIHAQRNGYLFPCVYALLNSKSDTTYDRMFSKLLENEPALNPISIMVDFEKASINSLESHLTAFTSGCFFHLSQNIYRKIKTEGLAQEYIQDMEYGIKLKMLASLAFVPETDVIDSFNILMAEFPQSASNIAKYFVNYSIGKKLPHNTRRIPTFPIRLWNMHTRILNNMPRTNNCVEGWHNAFKSAIYAMRTQAFLSF